MELTVKKRRKRFWFFSCLHYQTNGKTKELEDKQRLYLYIYIYIYIYILKKKNRRSVSQLIWPTSHVKSLFLLTYMCKVRRSHCLVRVNHLLTFKTALTVTSINRSPAFVCNIVAILLFIWPLHNGLCPTRPRSTILYSQIAKWPLTLTAKAICNGNKFSAKRSYRWERLWSLLIWTQHLPVALRKWRFSVYWEMINSKLLILKHCHISYSIVYTDWRV